MALTMDSNGIYQAMIEAVFLPTVQECMEKIYREIVHSIGNNPDIIWAPQEDVELVNANWDSTLNQITAACESRGWALLASFGTGESMDKHNPDLQDYMKSHVFNPCRTGYKIVGRPKGQYENMFGEMAESGGTMAGKPLNFAEINPNYVIQNAERRLERGLKEGGFVWRTLEMKIEQFFDETDLSDFFIEV